MFAEDPRPGHAAAGGPRMLPRPLELAGLFLAVLNVPTASTAAAATVAGGRLIGWLARPASHPRLWLRLWLLLLFVVAHYATAISHGYTDLRGALRYGIVILGLYAAGHAVGDPRAPRHALHATLALAGGLVAFSWLSVSRAIGFLRYQEIGDRAVASFWNASEIVNGPGLGAMASLGMCLAPIAILAPFTRGPARTRWVAGLSAGALAAAGTYANLALQNRTPVMAAAASAAVASWLAARSRRGAGRAAVVLAVAAAGALLWALLTADWAGSGFGLWGRFQERGLSSERYQAWWAMLRGMFDHPLGGRGVRLPGMLYAHNLWLDVAYETGLVPLALLLAFHASHAGCLWRLITAGTATLETLALACLATSFALTFAVEPSLEASAAHFAASGFVLGLVLRRDREPAGEPAPLGAWA